MTLLLSPLLHKRISARAIVQDFSSAIRHVAYRFDETTSAIDCWGDSLTEGRSLTPGHDFPALLAYVFHRKTNNRGISGETSQQIMDRMLSRPVSRVPESVIIWAGRNDDVDKLGAAEQNIRTMIGSLQPGSRFLVLGLLNRDIVRERKGGDQYRQIVAFNESLQEEYQERFVPIQHLLVAQGKKNDADDEKALEDDVVPPSLRLDPLHLNDQGEALVAYAVESAIKANGW